MGSNNRLFLATRILRGIAKSNESLQPVITPLIILLAIFAFSTWVITPISNLFLRLNPYGKYLLSREEKLSSSFVGISLLVCVIGFIGYIFLLNVGWLIIALFGFVMMVPAGSTLTAGSHKTKMVIYTAVMFVLGIIGTYQTFITNEPFNMFTLFFGIGFIAYQWIANYLNIRQTNV